MFGIRRPPDTAIPGTVRGIRTHIGVDFLAPVNQPVFSTADGVVVQIVDLANRTRLPASPGNPSPTAPLNTPDITVTIHHEPYEFGWVSSYRHLEEPLTVDLGEAVGSGQQLGQVGDPGRGIETHLHFEVRQVINEPLLNSYLSAYGPNRAVPLGTIIDLSGVASGTNLGNTEHSLPLDPTRVLYDWEIKLNRIIGGAINSYRNAVISRFGHIRIDRLPLLSIGARRGGIGRERQFYIPLVSTTDEELYLIETLRQAFLNRSRVNLRWRESLFFSQVATGNNQFLDIIHSASMRR